MTIEIKKSESDNFLRDWYIPNPLKIKKKELKINKCNKLVLNNNINNKLKLYLFFITYTKKFIKGYKLYIIFSCQNLANLSIVITIS